MARAATTSDVFNAIAEPQRREILVLLRAGERPVAEGAGRTFPTSHRSPSLPAAVARAVSGIRVSAAADEDHDRHLTRPA